MAAKKTKTKIETAKEKTASPSQTVDITAEKTSYKLLPITDNKRRMDRYIVVHTGETTDTPVFAGRLTNEEEIRFLKEFTQDKEAIINNGHTGDITVWGGFIIGGYPAVAHLCTGDAYVQAYKDLLIKDLDILIPFVEKRYVIPFDETTYPVQINKPSGWRSEDEEILVSSQTSIKYKSHDRCMFTKELYESLMAQVKEIISIPRPLRSKKLEWACMENFLRAEALAMVPREITYYPYGGTVGDDRLDKLCARYLLDIGDSTELSETESLLEEAGIYFIPSECLNYLVGCKIPRRGFPFGGSILDGSTGYIATKPFNLTQEYGARVVNLFERIYGGQTNED